MPHIFTYNEEDQSYLATIICPHFKDQMHVKIYCEQKSDHALKTLLTYAQSCIDSWLKLPSAVFQQMLKYTQEYAIDFIEGTDNSGIDAFLEKEQYDLNDSQKSDLFNDLAQHLIKTFTQEAFLHTDGRWSSYQEEKAKKVTNKIITLLRVDLLHHAYDDPSDIAKNLANLIKNELLPKEQPYTLIYNYIDSSDLWRYLSVPNLIIDAEYLADNLIAYPDQIVKPVLNLEMWCPWEVEHGLEWLIHQEEPIYVGSVEYPFFRSDEDFHHIKNDMGYNYVNPLSDRHS